MKPLFVVVDGIDGSGTTSCSKLLVQKINDIPNQSAVWTKEPSDGTIGRHIRRVLKGEEAADEHAMFPMFLADRHDHLCNRVRPELQQGSTVICDRYAYSTWVYQQDNYEKFLIEYLQRCCEVPDLVVVLDCPVEVAMARIGKRDHVERYEIEEKQRVYRKRYRQLQPLANEPILVLDSNRNSSEDLAETIYQEMLRL